jgi:hypothetical protein
MRCQVIGGLKGAKAVQNALMSLISQLNPFSFCYFINSKPINQYDGWMAI